MNIPDIIGHEDLTQQHLFLHYLFKKQAKYALKLTNKIQQTERYWFLNIFQIIFLLLLIPITILF